MFRKALTAGVAMAAFVPVAAFSAGTEQEQDACRPDVMQYCQAEVNEPERVAGTKEQLILLCLKQNRSKITPACNKVLVDHGQ
jgi:hypothetical protein